MSGIILHDDIKLKLIYIIAIIDREIMSKVRKVESRKSGEGFYKA